MFRGCFAGVSRPFETTVEFVQTKHTDSRALAHAMPIVEVAKRQKVALQPLFEAMAVGDDLSREAVRAADLEIKYAGYFARERTAAARLQRMGEVPLPEDAAYLAMRSLSVEARQKLAARRPATLAQAASIPGVSPADLQNLVLEMERHRLPRVSSRE